MELDTKDREISSVEQGFRQALIGAFIEFYNNTGEHSKWSDAAVMRFKGNLTNARVARALALRVIEETGQ